MGPVIDLARVLFFYKKKSESLASCLLHGKQEERDNVSSIQEIERITHLAADTLARRKSSFHYLLCVYVTSNHFS